jgi:tRNA threonylcarbamoyladenosine modification (KEOPS) complex  Pcc1 subunit
MGEIIRFVPKSERDRARQIREARAIYDSIFPSVDQVEQRRAPASHTIKGADGHRGDGVLS